MLKLYAVKDNHFDPMLNEDILTKIEVVTKDLYPNYFNSVYDKGNVLFSLLEGINKNSKSEVIIAYEILYNLYEQNINLDDIFSYLDENNKPISMDSLEDFILENLGTSDSIIFKKAFLYEKCLNENIISKSGSDYISISLHNNGTELELIHFLESLLSVSEETIDELTNNSFIYDISYSQFNVYKNILIYLKDTNIVNVDKQTLDEWMLKPKYSYNVLDSNAVSSENQVFDLYSNYLKLNNPSSPANINSWNTIFKDMYDDLQVEPLYFTNEHKSLSGTIVKMSNRFLEMFNNPEKNKFADWVIGYESSNNCNLISTNRLNLLFDEFLLKVINTIDSYNKELWNNNILAREELKELLIEVNNLKGSNETLTADSDLIENIWNNLKKVIEFKIKRINYFDLPKDFLLKETFNKEVLLYSSIEKVENFEDFEWLIFLQKLSSFFSDSQPAITNKLNSIISEGVGFKNYIDTIKTNIKTEYPSIF